MSERAGYFRNADGIRGLACLIVLLIHAVNGIFPGARPYLPGTGKAGVWLFFVLSAFLLTNHLFLRGTTWRSLVDYVLARVLRIVPLFFVAVLFYFAFGTTTITTWTEVGKALTLSEGYAHLWTVPVEMKFYILLFPLAVPTIAIDRKFGPAWSGAFVVAVALVSSIAFPFTEMPENSPELRWYVPCFLIGMFCAVIYPSIKERVSRLPSTAITVLVFISIVAMTDCFRAMYYPHAPDYWLGNKFTPLGMLWAVFMVVNLDDAGVIGRLLASRFMTKLGHWSYPIYLFHWYFVSKAWELLPDSVLSAMTSIVLAIAVGAAAHRWIERPMMSARGRIGRLVLRRSAVSQGAGTA